MTIIHKIKGINTIIKKGLDKMSNPYLACSWGKDSTVLLYFVRQIKPNIPIIYLNSGYSFPDVYEFRDRLLNENDLNYIELKQEIDYLELCKQIGLPHERSKQDQDKAVKLIKKNVLDDFVKQENYDGCFWGIRSDESRKRKDLIRYKGTCFKNVDSLYRCSPLAYISDFEIWQIIDILKIQYCFLYDKNDVLKRSEIRNSGWISTDGAERGKILHTKRYYPELFNKLVKEFPKIRSYI